MQEIIHLLNGDTVRAEVNGKSLDGQAGFAFLAADCGSLLATLLEGRAIEVVKRSDEEWDERAACQRPKYHLK
jgi:hypothetical protein